MALALFTDKGYKFTTDKRVVLFSEDGQHIPLLDYISKDVEAVFRLIAQYLAKAINEKTFDLKDYKEAAADANKILEKFALLHPYYEHVGKAVIIGVLGDYFNGLLIQSGVWADEKANNKEWYLERFVVITSPFLEVGDMYPEDFYSKYEDAVGDKPGYQIEETFAWIPPSEGIDRFTEVELQNRIKRMLFWLFDISAPGIGELPINQRLRLYEKIFEKDAQLEVKVTKKMALTTRPDDVIGNGSNNCNDPMDLYESLRKDLEDYHTSQENISPETLSNLSNAIDAAKETYTEKPCDEYIITSLNQLLFLEILRMIEAETIIKRCKNCGEYFVVTNLNMAFCSRVAKDETKPCNVIGSKRVYDKKISGDVVIKAYYRGYRTRHAQESKGLITYEDFIKWDKEAKEKRDKVKAGELTLAEFEEWLSDGVRKRRRREK